MRFLPVVLLLGACDFSTNVDVPRDMMGDGKMIDARPIDGPPGAARKRRITIPDNKVAGSFTDFPVWFVITDMPGLGTKATTAGNDIYFTRTDGTPLEHERITWNKATGYLEAWVKLDLVDGGNTEFDLRFGDAGPAHAPDAPAVWTNSFAAVWHMEDAANVSDARGAVNGTAVGGPTTATTGKLGKAIDFDGMNDEVTFTNPLTGDGSHTISAWVSVASPIGASFSTVLCVGNNATGESRFLHTDRPGLSRGFFNNDTTSSVDIHNSTFTLLHWVYDSVSKESTLYRDAALVGAVTVMGTIDTQGTGGHIGSSPMQWGFGGNTVNYINGLMDEVRIVSAVRPFAWIQTEYENQRAPLAFYNLGPDVPAQ